VQGWLVSVSEEDGDEVCRHMAAACSQLHGALAAEALTSLAALPGSSAWPSSLGGSSGVVGQVDVGAGGLVQGPLGMVRRGVVLPSSSLQVSIGGQGGGILVPGIGLTETGVPANVSPYVRPEKLSGRRPGGASPLIMEV
jgi:hypothetical protein